MYSEKGEFEVQVCFSPLSWPLFARDNALVIVADIFRATTAMCAAFEHGIKDIIPVESIAESQGYKDKGYICAGERDGKTLACADFGNSPFNFMDPALKGKTIVMNTTNGTRAIKIASERHNRIAIGAFVNLEAVSRYAVGSGRPVVILCAGWKDRFCTEDALFAGAAVERIVALGKGAYHTMCDSAIASATLWNAARTNLYSFTEKIAHRHRLRKMGLDDVISYCMTPDTTDVVPVWQEDRIIAFSDR